MDLSIKDIIAMGGDLSVVITLAIVVYLFVTGKILPKEVYERLIDQNQALMKAYFAEMGDTITAKVIEAVKQIFKQEG